LVKICPALVMVVEARPSIVIEVVPELVMPVAGFIIVREP